MEHKHIRHLKRHRNVLYGAIMVLLLLQIATFFVMTSQGSRLIAQQEESKEYLEAKIGDDIKSVRQEMRFNVEELGKTVAQQGLDFKEEINLLKSTQDDFSGIAESSIKGVVSVATDTSGGSGFFVSPEYVVTNWHVIQGASYVKVIDYTGREISAQVIGADDFTDIAVLKVSGNFDYLSLEDSDDVQVGEKVLAIGNPLGLSFTVTEGIVSAVNRRGPNGLEAYVQTDVTLNPGNSGGPLIDREGYVVGVNNFKIGGAEGLGFALESDLVREKVNEIANQTLIG